MEAKTLEEQKEEYDQTSGRVESGSEDGGAIYVKQNEDGSMESYVGLAEGSVIRRTDFSGSTWENDPFWEAGIPAGEKSKISKALKFYERDPLVNKSVKLLAQLANDSFTVSSDDDNVEKFFKAWWRDIGGWEFSKFFFLEYFRSGNVPIFKTLIPYKPQNYEGNTTPKLEASKKGVSIAEKSMKIQQEYEEAYATLSKVKWHYARGSATKRKLNAAEKTYAAKKYTWSKSMIPGSYTILNPLSIDIEGPTGIPWGRQIFLNIEADVAKIVKNPAPEVKVVLDAIPKDILSQIKSGKEKVYLPPEMATMVTRDKQPYETWAQPITTHAFEALDYKYELREMDRATVRSVRNRILKVTVGNDQYPVFDKKVIQQLSKEFNNPSRTLTLFWNHTLNIEYVEPNLDSLNMAKYEPVNDDIRTCYGITKVLTGGDGDSIGNNVLNLKGLLEVLTEAQESFLNWFHQESKRVCQAIGLPVIPEGSFGKLNLKDENEYIKVLAALVDRQIISYETMVETVGYYFPREVERLKKEQKLRESDNILVAQKAPTQQEGGQDPSGQEGRPAGKTEDGDRNNKKGKPKTGDGLKVVAKFDPAKYESTKAEILELHDQSLKIAKALAKEGEKIQENYTKSWYSVLKLIHERYNVIEDLDTFIIFSIAKAHEIHKNHQDKSFADILASAVSKEVSNK